MSEFKVRKVGIIMNGVTGRMGTNQHLLRSIVAIIKQGGVKPATGSSFCPIRSWWEKCAEAAAARAALWRDALDNRSRRALADKQNVIYFDSQTTDGAWQQ